MKEEESLTLTFPIILLIPNISIYRSPNNRHGYFQLKICITYFNAAITYSTKHPAFLIFEFLQQSQEKPNKRKREKDLFMCASSWSLPPSTKVSPGLTVQWFNSGGWTTVGARRSLDFTRETFCDLNGTRGRCRVLDDYPHRAVFPRRDFLDAVHYSAWESDDVYRCVSSSFSFVVPRKQQPWFHLDPGNRRLFDPEGWSLRMEHDV